MFGSLITAMVTPYRDDLSLNLDLAGELADFLVENGSDSLVVSGTTGESPVLSIKEKLDLFKAVSQAVKGRAKVIAGTGNYCTEETIELTQKAEKAGVDGCMLVVPYYNKPPQEGLKKHFQAVAAKTSLPILLYNVPSRTACNLEAETTIELSSVENIIGIKEASGNLAQIGKIIAATPDNFLVYSGDDAFTFPLLALGGDGVISVASHVAGPQIKKMINLFKKGDFKKALDYHHKLMPLFKTLFLKTNPILTKASVELIGFPVGPPRLPLIEATTEDRQKLKKILEEIKAID